MYMPGHQGFHIQFVLEINERNRLIKSIMRAFINKGQGGEMYSVIAKEHNFLSGQNI